MSVFTKLVIGSLAVLAGTGGGVALAQSALTSPYRHQLQGEIRGLAPEEIRELREGHGMGQARAAELNSYPGPRHVLDAVDAGQLRLRADQVEAVRQVHARMADEARHLGARVLAEEQALETAFRSATITEPNLADRVARLAALRGELRLVHLRAHLYTRAALTPEQLARYDEVRGYAGAGAPHQGGGDRHRH